MAFVTIFFSINDSNIGYGCVDDYVWLFPFFLGSPDEQPTLDQAASSKNERLQPLPTNNREPMIPNSKMDPFYWMIGGGTIGLAFFFFYRAEPATININIDLNFKGKGNVDINDLTKKIIEVLNGRKKPPGGTGGTGSTGCGSTTPGVSDSHNPMSYATVGGFFSSGEIFSKTTLLRTPVFLIKDFDRMASQFTPIGATYTCSTDRIVAGNWILKQWLSRNRVGIYDESFVAKSFNIFRKWSKKVIFYFFFMLFFNLI
jgi:hypothetical protein